MPEKLDIQSIIHAQMVQFYSAIAQEKENRVKVRNWEISNLVAFIAFLSSNISSKIPKGYASLILIGIILIFWTIEAFYQSLVLAYFKRVSRLEKLLGEKTEVPKTVPLDLFFENGFYSISTKRKITLFFQAFFCSKSILIFNGVLIMCVLLWRIFVG